MTTWERKTTVSDFRIPAGYEVTHHENRGYDSPDRWYEAHEGKRKVGEYGYKDDAIEACCEDAKKKGWAKSRYDIIAADDEEEPTPAEGCGVCGKTKNEEDDSEVLWKCSVCEKTVCRACTLTIPGSRPAEYFYQTLCSHVCWEKAGRPDE